MQRSPPSRSSTLGNVLETEDGAETPRQSAARRRVTSPESAHPFDPPRPGNNHDPYTSAVRLGSSRSPPPPSGDSHRKPRSTLRLSRLRPGLGKEEMAQLDGEGTPDAPTWDSHARPSSARGNPPADRMRAMAVRRPGSAGEIARKTSVHAGEDTVTRPGSSSGVGKGRGMRVRASSELTRPSVPMPTPRHDADERSRARYTELRPPLPLLSTGASTLAPVPVSPGVQSTRSGRSGESALADDSDVDADVPTTPSLTTGASRAGSRSNSSAKDAASLDPRSQGLSTTPKPSAPILDSEVDRSQAREDADRRRRGEAAREREEKKRHSEYFVLKGPSKERCHVFPVDKVPYPVSYSPKILDHYALDTDLSVKTISSVTYHRFAVPPAKVLDVGCGTGYWILKAAREWTETEFVGFDLVPIQPNLERVSGKSGVSMNGNSHADLRLHERIRWVHGNFLEGLPFKDAEFDMVRCRKIARGVPESKWDGLYEEFVRVMKPGAAFEHIEEDIIFPSEIPTKPNPPPVAVYPTPSPSRTLPTPPYLSSTSLPPGASPVRPPDQYRRSPSTSFSSVLDSPVEGRNAVPSVSSASSASLAGSTEPFATRFNSSPINTRSTLVVPGPAVTTPTPDSFPRDSRGSGDSAGGGRTTDYSFYDPRVHARLHELYVSMHDARWINLKPLTIIPRLIQEHMAGTIFSPPLNMCLPPRPREGPPLSRSVNILELARASGEGLSKQLARIHAAQTGKPMDETLFIPQPDDKDVSRYLTFDLTRVGAVSKNGGVGIMPANAFQFNLGWLPMHLSTAASEVLACKEAMWEHLKEQDPSFDRREYDAMIRQYKTDMQDRIGLSAALREKMHWGPPESDFMRTPDQRVFEEQYAQAIARDQADPGNANRPPTLMRCWRAFVAFKASE